jgi:hypothetical protein
MNAIERFAVEDRTVDGGVQVALRVVQRAGNQYAATMHFVGQTTILTLTRDRGTGETYCMPHHLTIKDGSRRLMIAALRYLRVRNPRKLPLNALSSNAFSRTLSTH